MAQAPIELKVGQIWTIKDAPPTAHLTVGRIETYGNGQVVHISVGGAQEYAPGFYGRIGHMPFDRDALNKSVDRLVGENASVDEAFASGYETWTQEGGGVFTLTVHEVIGMMVTMAPPEGPTIN